MRKSRCAQADALGKALTTQLAIQNSGDDENEHLYQNNAHVFTVSVEQTRINETREQQEHKVREYQQKRCVQGLGCSIFTAAQTAGATHQAVVYLPPL